VIGGADESSPQGAGKKKSLTDQNISSFSVRL
jgi:hypothetical protein